MDAVLQRGTEKLLWIPPAKPYYELQGAFKDANYSTKTLIFSSWEMVPRMLACLISYEAERRTVGKLVKDNEAREVRYFYTGEKRYPAARMNFSVRNDEPAAMTLFCLIYPSKTLADVYNPIACMNEGFGIRDIRQKVKEKIAIKLQDYPSPQSGTPDKAWYYIAPLLLDGEKHVELWFGSSDKLVAYDNEEEKAKKQKGFTAHLDALKVLYYQCLENIEYALGKRPDDLLDVLADMAMHCWKQRTLS